MCASWSAAPVRPGSRPSALLREAGARHIAVYDSHGPLHPKRDDLSEPKRWLATHTAPPGPGTSLPDALAGADVFIGVSGPGVIGADDVAAMAGNAIVFALANPEPEIGPEIAAQHAAVVGNRPQRPPRPDQRRARVSGGVPWAAGRPARELSTAAQIAAAHAVADTVSNDTLDAQHIVPSVFDDRLVPAVARAVAEETQT